MNLPALARRATRAGSRHAMLALVALVLVVQGFNVSVSSARGPSHTHRAPVLADFRRDVGPSTAEFGLFVWPEHHHGVALRHHHSASDPTVVFETADQASDAASEDGSIALELAIAAFIAIVLTMEIGSLRGLSHQRASRAGWQPSTGFFTRLDRPPQLA